MDTEGVVKRNGKMLSLVCIMVKLQQVYDTWNINTCY